MGKAFNIEYGNFDPVLACFSFFFLMLVSIEFDVTVFDVPVFNVTLLYQTHHLVT